MAHGMAPPFGIIYVFKAQSGIKSLGRGVALVYQQSRRQIHPPGFPAGGFEQRGGNALSAMACGYGQTVYIQFAGPCFVIHARMIHAKGRLCACNERLPQAME